MSIARLGVIVWHIMVWVLVKGTKRNIGMLEDFLIASLIWLMSVVFYPIGIGKMTTQANCQSLQLSYFSTHLTSADRIQCQIVRCLHNRLSSVFFLGLISKLRPSFFLTSPPRLCPRNYLRILFPATIFACVLPVSWLPVCTLGKLKLWWVSSPQGLVSVIPYPLKGSALVYWFTWLVFLLGDYFLCFLPACWSCELRFFTNCSRYVSCNWVQTLHITPTVKAVFYDP